MKILRQAIDLRMVAAALVFVSVQFSIYAAAPLWIAVLFLPVLAFGCGIMGAINHNHMHFPVFVTPQLNLAFNYLLSWAMGASATQLLVTHVFIHHRYFRSEKDWTRYSQAQGHGWRRIMTYLSNTIREVRCQRTAFLSKPHRHRWLRQIQIERSFICLIAILLFLRAPLPFLIVYLLPWLGGLLLVLVVNLIQHDELDLTSEFHSRDFRGALGNALTFNTFYHTAHHEKPQLHWSRLPEIPLRDVISTEDHVLSFVWRRYLRLYAKPKSFSSPQNPPSTG
jgi:fatty acid desaturase